MNDDNDDQDEDEDGDGETRNVRDDVAPTAGSSATAVDLSAAKAIDQKGFEQAPIVIALHCDK